MKSTGSFGFSKEMNSLSSLLDLTYAFQKSKVLLTACELNIFTALGDEQKTALQVSEEIDADEKGIFKLLCALTSINLLKKNADQFSNTALTRQYFVKDGKDYMGTMQHLSLNWEAWGNLTESVKTGKASKLRNIYEYSDDELEGFMDSIHWRGKFLAPTVADMIYLSKASRMLDLGGGSGTFAMEFVRAKPDLKVVVFDQPQIIPHTQRYIEHYGFADKIETITGDYLSDDLGSGYDIVFVSMILNRHSIWENIALTQKIYESLNPGGQIIIQDYIVNDERTSPVFNVLHSLNQLVSTEAGDTYTETDIWIVLKEAWFKNVKVKETGYGTRLVFGEK